MSYKVPSINRYHPKRAQTAWDDPPVTDEEHFDWEAPLNASGPTRTDALHRALALRSPELSAFTTHLHATISSANWGFVQLAHLADVEQRALVSDQLLSAVDGLVDALVDAAIELSRAMRYTGLYALPPRSSYLTSSSTACTGRAS
ncbi:MAG: hypothetical protein QOD05_1172 [Microbacteriaceae bacterium]|jgi:hypothetical protein|nr:hypothetical protein [Microbacteriaceae bacterium]